MPIWWGIACQVRAVLSACSSPVVFAPFCNTKFLWYNKSSSSPLLDLLSQQPSSLINAVHEDIRVSMPSLRLQLATSQPVGCWEPDDGTEDPFTRNSDIASLWLTPQLWPNGFLSGLQLSSFQQHKWISLSFIIMLQSIWKDNWVHEFMSYVFTWPCFTIWGIITPS